jgi:hypothetical protein
MPSLFVTRILMGLVLLSVAGAAQAEALRDRDPPAESRFPPFTGSLPPCDDSMILGEITLSFYSREAEFWHSGLAIERFESIAETGFRTNGPSYIPRRYCRAEALFNDGRRRRVVYNIGEALGFIGIGSGVTWCVVGLDRNHAFSPNCRAAGP